MSRPCALYRHYDDFGDLLYVGISLSAVARLSAHRKAPWFSEISDMTTEWFPSREEAHEAEKQAIRDEQPIHNVQRYGGSPPPEPEWEDEPAGWSTELMIAMGSPLRRRLFAEGKLKPLDREKWEAGGYGPDPFGIAARRSAPALDMAAKGRGGFSCDGAGR